MSERCNISPRFSMKFFGRCNISRTFGFYNTLINRQKALKEYRISLPLALIVRRLSRRRNLIQPADPRRRNQRNPRDRECDRSRLRDGGCAQRQRRIDKPLYGTLKILATSTSSHHAVYELLVLFRQLGRN